MTFEKQGINNSKTNENYMNIDIEKIFSEYCTFPKTEKVTIDYEKQIITILNVISFSPNALGMPTRSYYREDASYSLSINLSGVFQSFLHHIFLMLNGVCQRHI